MKKKTDKQILDAVIKGLQELATVARAEAMQNPLAMITKHQANTKFAFMLDALIIIISSARGKPILPKIK